jgi:hypothetical protein
MRVATPSSKNSTTDFAEKMHQESLSLLEHVPYFTFVSPALELLFDCGTGWRVLGFGMNGVVFVALGFAVIVAWGSRASNVRIYTLWPSESLVTKMRRIILT